MAGLTWEEYGRSIVDGLADVKAELREASAESRRVAIQLSLLKERSESVAKFETRLSAVESQLEASEDRANTLRKVLGAVSLTLVGTIMLPILRAWLTAKGGAGP